MINDANGNPENPDHADPGRTGEFNLNRFSAGEAKRVELEMEGLDPELGNRVTVRFWVRHVGGYYGEMTAWDVEPEVNLRGELLRRAVDLDVFARDQWHFPGPGTLDVEGWTTCAEEPLAAVDGALQVADGGCAQSPPWTTIDGETFPAMAFRARSTAPDVKLTWDGGEAPLNVPADGAWHEVTSPYAGDELWRGTVTTLEIRVAGGELEVDKIELSRTADPEPEYPEPNDDVGNDVDAGLPDLSGTPDGTGGNDRATRTEEGCSCETPASSRATWWLRRR